MNESVQYTFSKILLISLTGAIFIIYPNLSCFSWEWPDSTKQLSFLAFFIFRYVFFVVLIGILTRYNLVKIKELCFKKRLIYTFSITAAAYLLYVVVSLACYKKHDCFGGVLLFQFFVVGILSTIAGHVFFLYNEQRRKEQEIEQLKIENLQSRYDALTNQINPHFFFNSLNGITALIRKKDNEKIITYVNTLSDVFRYILQSDKKGLVLLEEELKFIQSFRYMMEIRFADKLEFSIETPQDKMNLKIPVLSLLPLVDNVVEHNTIDSEHKMTVSIRLNHRKELVVSNPLFPKLTPPTTNGTGLRNLENRFALLMNRQIRIENDGKIFSVYLPLK
jgi:sensor histidine kinase YesM